MRSHYKHAMEKLSLSSGALEKIQAQAAGPCRRIFPRRYVSIAAAFCVAVVLLSTGVAGAYGYFFHEIPDEVARFLQPIKLSHTSQDITMTIQYASVEKGTLTMYVTMEDISGKNRLAEGVDFHHSYRIERPEAADSILYCYKSLGYDESSHTYGFLIEIKPTNENGDVLYFQNQQYMLSVGQLLLAQVQTELSLSPDWSTLPMESDSWFRPSNESGYVNSYHRKVYSSDGTVEVLMPGSWGLPVTEGFTITAAGFLDNGFHIQLRYDDRQSVFDYGNLELVTSKGEKGDTDEFCFVIFYDEYHYKYKEYIYDITPEELKGASLTGSFASGGYLLDGDWEVSFTLGEEEASQ